MDIRARTILSLIKSIKGAEQSIIAGGAVRDSFFDVPPKDFDFFIPDDAFKQVIQEVRREIAPKSPPPPVPYPSSGYFIKKSVDKLADYVTSYGGIFAKEKSEHPDLKDVVDLEYEGIQLQLMSVPHLNDDEFALKVIDRFDYGINMAYYDSGVVIRDTEKFQFDLNNRRMTLYQLFRMEDLPKTMEKFNRVSAKLGGRWEFHSPRLSLVDLPKEETKVGVTTPEMKEDFGRMRLRDAFPPELAPRAAPRGRWIARDWAVQQLEVLNPANEIPLQPIQENPVEWVEPEFDDDALLDEFRAVRDRIINN